MHAHLAALIAAHHAAAAAPTAHGSAIFIAVIAGAIGVTLYAYGHARRFQCWMIAIAAGACVIGVSVWTDALAALIDNWVGQLFLVGIVVVSGFAFHMEAVHDAEGRRIRQAKRKRRKGKKDAKAARRRGDDDYADDISAELELASKAEVAIPHRRSLLDNAKHHHPVRSPFISTVFGTAFTLALISIGLIAEDLWQSVTGLGTGLVTQSSRVNSGKAAAAAVKHHHSPVPVLLAAFLIVGMVFYLAHKVHQHREDANNNGGGGGRNNRGGGGSGGGGGGRGSKKNNRNNRNNRNGGGGNGGGNGGGSPWGGTGVWPGGGGNGGGRAPQQIGGGWQ